MVAFVEQMLALHKRRAAAKTPHEQTVLQAQIDATDRQMAPCARFAIDRLVYKLYGLTEEEIRIVEGGSKLRIPLFAVIGEPQISRYARWSLHPILDEAQEIFEIRNRGRLRLIKSSNVDMMRCSGNLWPVRSIVSTSTQFTAGFHPLVRVFAATISEHIVSHLKPAAVTQNSSQLEEIRFALLLVPHHFP